MLPPGIRECNLLSWPCPFRHSDFNSLKHLMVFQLMQLCEFSWHAINPWCATRSFIILHWLLYVGFLLFCPG